MHVAGGNAVPSVVAERTLLRLLPRQRGLRGSLHARTPIKSHARASDRSSPSASNVGTRVLCDDEQFLCRSFAARREAARTPRSIRARSSTRHCPAARAPVDRSEKVVGQASDRPQLGARSRARTGARDVQLVASAEAARPPGRASSPSRTCLRASTRGGLQRRAVGPRPRRAVSTSPIGLAELDAQPIRPLEVVADELVEVRKLG